MSKLFLPMLVRGKCRRLYSRQKKRCAKCLIGADWSQGPISTVRFDGRPNAKPDIAVIMPQAVKIIR